VTHLSGAPPIYRHMGGVGRKEISVRKAGLTRASRWVIQGMYSTHTIIGPRQGCLCDGTLAELFGESLVFGPAVQYGDLATLFASEVCGE